MSKRPFKLAVVIGRFQPFHAGHKALIQKAFATAENVLVLIGSSGIARNIKNPFTYQERVSMVTSVFVQQVAEGIMYLSPISDNLYNDNIWLANVQKAVGRVCLTLDLKDEDICLVGHFKDQSSYYLEMFPHWDLVTAENTEVLDATQVRNILFGNKLLPDATCVPREVLDFITHWKKQLPAKFVELCDEHKFIQEYKAQWSAAPFPPTFVTTDAVVVCSGHILLVKRRHTPGKGLWALPGGFLNQNERCEDGMLRELSEETRIKVDSTFLRASIKESRVFDHPNRSDRGRTITHAFLINLGWGPLPRVRGSDDAERAKWFPINSFLNNMKDKTFEDHHDIAMSLIG